MPSGTVKAPDNQSGEFILVAGHMDSWPVGASDNAAGNATAMEVARVLNADRNKLGPGCPLPLLAGARGRPDGGVYLVLR
ncbi:MAG: M28 family peptidase [Oscillospiraceae bacterium]